MRIVFVGFPWHQVHFDSTADLLSLMPPYMCYRAKWRLVIGVRLLWVVGPLPARFITFIRASFATNQGQNSRDSDFNKTHPRPLSLFTWGLAAILGKLSSAHASQWNVVCRASRAFVGSDQTVRTRCRGHKSGRTLLEAGRHYPICVIVAGCSRSRRAMTVGSMLR